MSKEGNDNKKKGADTTVNVTLFFALVYGFWLLFVLGIVSLASVLSYKTGQWRWMNLCWLILILAPNLSLRTGRSN